VALAMCLGAALLHTCAVARPMEDLGWLALVLRLFVR
jgi:hypothetical protein